MISFHFLSSFVLIFRDTPADQVARVEHTNPYEHTTYTREDIKTQEEKHIVMSPSPEVLANCEFGALQHGYSLAAAGIFCALFALTMVLHTWQMIATRSWFLTALVIGAVGKMNPM